VDAHDTRRLAVTALVCAACRRSLHRACRVRTPRV